MRLGASGRTESAEAGRRGASGGSGSAIGACGPGAALLRSAKMLDGASKKAVGDGESLRFGRCD